MDNVSRELKFLRKNKKEMPRLKALRGVKNVSMGPLIKWAWLWKRISEPEDMKIETYKTE